MKTKTTAKPKPFRKLNAAQKRVAIAKDALSQIRRQKYDIASGTWLAIYPDMSIGDRLDAPAVQKLLLGKFKHKGERLTATCSCCAIGAACASAVRLFNRDDLDGGAGIDDWSDAVKVLSRYFGKRQMSLIEACFEHRTAAKEGNYGTTIFSAADWDVIEAFHSPPGEELEFEYTAVKIFRNIIRHGGTFKP